MALSTTQYGYIIDPMVPFTDENGKTIKNGFVRVFVEGSSTPVVTYRNFDGATNTDRIELDNSGRTKTSVIGSKGLTYKVCVYDQHHSQESPILTVDKVSVIGANITAGTGATVITGLDGFRTKPDGFVDASVVGTDGYVAIDHTLVTDDLDTDAKVTAVENDRYVPLLNEDVNKPDSKMTLGRQWQWVLGKIKSLSTTITAFRTGDVIPVDGPSGTAKMAKDDLLRVTAENAVDSGVAASQRTVQDINERTEDCHEYGEPYFAVTDPNGYIGFSVDNEGNLKGIFFDKFKESTENGFVVTDPNGYIGFSVDNEGNTTFKEKIDTNISLVLPSKIPVVQDRVNFFYYENILKNGWLSDGILVNSNNNTDHDSNIFKVSNTGTQTITYNAYDGEKIVASKTFNRVTISKTQAGSFKVCVLGDSKTDNASKLAQLLNICQQDGNLSVTLLGSITETYEDADGNSRSVSNEGYSGSKVQNFCRSETISGHTNIFYDSNIADTNKFNFAKGVTALGDVPDILWIDLGANQANDSKSEVMGCYESIIQSVKDYNTANSTNIKVVISVQEFGGCLPYILSNGSGKAFLNSSEVKVEDYIQAFDNREDEGVFICPQYVCIDPFNDYPMTDIPESIGIGNGPTRRVALDVVHPGVNTDWYNSLTTYNTGNICKTTNKVMALCLKDGTIGITPTDDKVNWSLTIGNNANLGYFKLAEMYFAVLKYIASV